MNWLIVLPFAVLSGILGRMGGSQYYNTKWRDAGIPVIQTVYLLIVGIHSPWLVGNFAALWGSLTTYWDEVPFNKGEDNFFMHGFFCGLAALFICFVTGHWWLMAIRSIGLALFMGIWHLKHPKKINGWDGAQVEEFGRYFVLTMSLPIIL
jgi:hypothetical protein